VYRFAPVVFGGDDFENSMKRSTFGRGSPAGMWTSGSGKARRDKRVQVTSSSRLFNLKAGTSLSSATAEFLGNLREELRGLLSLHNVAISLDCPPEQLMVDLARLMESERRRSNILLSASDSSWKNYKLAVKRVDDLRLLSSTMETACAGILDSRSTGPSNDTLARAEVQTELAKLRAHIRAVSDALQDDLISWRSSEAFSAQIRKVLREVSVGLLSLAWPCALTIFQAIRDCTSLLGDAGKLGYVTSSDMSLFAPDRDLNDNLMNEFISAWRRESGDRLLTNTYVVAFHFKAKKWEVTKGGWSHIKVINLALCQAAEIDASIETPEKREHPAEKHHHSSALAHEQSLDFA
jgi:hypothetical protein